MQEIVNAHHQFLHFICTHEFFQKHPVQSHEQSDPAHAQSEQKQSQTSQQKQMLLSTHVSDCAVVRVLLPLSTRSVASTTLYMLLLLSSGRARLNTLLPIALNKFNAVY